MQSRFASAILFAPAFFLAAGRSPLPPEKVQLTVATLHAAALTTPRVAGDSTDTPFILFAVIGRRSSTASVLPESGQLSIRHDGAVGARPLTELSLESGDSVQVLVSVLENGMAQDARSLGSVSLLLTSEGGTVYWRRLDCVSSCKILTGPAPIPLNAASGQPTSGVAELTGSGGTYHLALQAKRAP